MAFQLSPGVNVSEIDLTTIVPSVVSSAGAYAGTFNWGPASKIIQVDSEKTLYQMFTPANPDSNSAVSFFTCSSFLAYGNNLNLVRAVGANSKNADSNTSVTNVQVKNEDVFQASYMLTNNGNSYGPFMARYPGALGNGITVSVCDNPTDFATWTYKG